MFYLIFMESKRFLSVLEEQARAQMELLRECRRRAVVARDERMRSTWIGVFIRLSDALTETAFAWGSLEKVGVLDTLPGSLLAKLCLPMLPPLPQQEGTPPPRDFRKTTSDKIHNAN